MVSLPSYLSGFEKSQYDPGTQIEPHADGGISSWAEAVQYALRNYAQSTRVSEPIYDLREILLGHVEI